ncbi:COG5377 Phage-related protein, predicted endonuclease [uncultured Caudovirales phage]|uniref:COG5377 Phage-related protein, predicted endonuclease n=1 Tax=uncultured Caudovirales phage TaxID=2100421 RepID=A0A6J5N6V2_9CAUD|nr:COG5377 Phage-related protein, predicted endonuclease [uncultured Caudovirales phage]
MTLETVLVNAQNYGQGLHLGSFEPGSQEWHNLRATGIGGSDVGTICGLNPWQSAFTLWAKRTGKIEDDQSDSEAMEWGRRLESVILDKFAEEHPELDVIDTPGTFQNKDRAWQLANPDGIAIDRKTGEHIIIEIKTARYEDDWVNGVPEYYRTQVLWYLQTFGFQRAYVAALFCGSKYREFEVLADDFEQQTNLKRVEQFRTYLEQDKQPDYDGATSTYETIRRLHPDIEDIEVELGDLGVHYFNAAAAAAESDKKLTELKSRILDAMGKAKRGLVDGTWMLTRQARSGGTPYLVNKKG